MDKFDRPDWDTYFMTLAFIVAQRSIDPRTKHGCIAVDEDKTVIGLGYNGFPRDCDEAQLPLNEFKYPFLPHSEINLISNATRSGTCLKGSTVYLTGYPCTYCLGVMKGAGIKKVIYGNVQSFCVNERSRGDTDLLLKSQKRNKIELVPFTFEKNSEILNLLHKTHEYIIQKNKDLEIS